MLDLITLTFAYVVQEEEDIDRLDPQRHAISNASILYPDTASWTWTAFLSCLFAIHGSNHRVLTKFGLDDALDQEVLGEKSGSIQPSRPTDSKSSPDNTHLFPD